MCAFVVCDPQPLYVPPTVVSLHHTHAHLHPSIRESLFKSFWLTSYHHPDHTSSIMSHYTHRDASGRVISLLQEDNETSYESQRSYSFSQATSGIYGSSGYNRNMSYPNTPDLTRSDSYDSQASSHDPASPLTPASAYHEPLFPTKQSQNGTLHSRTASKDSPVYLPPISTFHKVAGPMEPKTARSPHESYTRQSATHFAPGMAHRSSSSSLEDYHYQHHGVDSHENYLTIATSRPEPTVHHSVEPSDDCAYHSRPSADKRKLAPQDHGDEDEDMADSGSKKGPKSKNGIQKRYPCKFRDICDKTFTTSGHASRHAKIHGGEKTIECSYQGCTKRFTRADNMKQHLETHKKDKSRRPDRLARGASHTPMRRRQSASSRGSVSRYSTPRDSPPLLSPAITAAPMVSPGLPTDGWTLARPSIASRTPSGLDALAMVAATEHASVEQEEAQRHAGHEAARFHYYQHLQHQQH